MKKISLSFGAVCADVYFFPSGAARSLLLLEPVRRDLSRLPLYRKDGALTGRTGRSSSLSPAWTGSGI